MATHNLDITGNFRPNAAGVYVQNYDAIDTGAVFSTPVIVFSSQTLKEGAVGRFGVPQNYVGTAKFIIKWVANATSGVGVFDLSYLNRANAEDMGAAAQGTTDTANTTTNGTAFRLNTTTITPTASNFSAGDESQAEIFRDAADASDTLAASVVVFGIIFQYSDT